MGSIRHALVTGGAGYFGECLVTKLLARGVAVRVFDLNSPSATAAGLDFVQGDIRDPAAVARACEGASHVFHNVAQVPLARDKDLFWSVNRDGTEILIDAARKAGVVKLVYTSSSAIFGAPDRNPVTEETPPAPAEDYGQAKLAGERACIASGIDTAVIRPRTILGHGRLGVVQILFDWVSRGLDLPVLSGGRNIYQFVHADDLADACILAAERSGTRIYNIGAEEFGSMRDLLWALARHAGTGSAVRTLPMAPIELAMRGAELCGLSPLGPYHALMYGRSLYFDISRAKQELGWQPAYGNTGMLCESYDWYLAHRDTLGGRQVSHHQSTVRQGIMSLVPHLLKLAPKA